MITGFAFMNKVSLKLRGLRHTSTYITGYTLHELITLQYVQQQSQGPPSETLLISEELVFNKKIN
jgi:hypothetical protein